MTATGQPDDHDGVADAATASPLRDSSKSRLSCRGIRGATTATANTAEDILEATTELLIALIQLNDLRPEDVASAIFTTTVDLTATFPALAARELGWTEVPLLCTHEMAVPGALGQVVRILLHVNTSRTAAEIRHIYLKGARGLRPDWALDDEQLAAVVGRRAVAAGELGQPDRQVSRR
jgi:chorismate mutase